MRRRKEQAHSDPSDLPPIQRLRWIFWLLIWLSVEAIWLLAMRQSPEFLLGQPSDDPAVSTVRVVAAALIPLALLLLAIHAFWRARIEWLAYQPGPLLIFPVVDWTVDRERGQNSADDQLGASARGEAVRAELQRLLVETQLQGSTAIPSPGRSSDFLQVVEEVGGRTDGFGGTLLRFVRLLSPRSSYEVRCSILQPDLVGGRAYSGSCVLLIELTRAPKHVLAPETVIEESWEQATAKAAAWIAAMVLPRTRKCKLAPWTLWQGLRLPPDLFSVYQEFRVEQDRGLYWGGSESRDLGNAAAHRKKCYVNALRALNKALKLDPSNLALRLEKGKLLELNSEYLAALETYDSIISQAARRDRRLAYLRFGPPHKGESDADAARRWNDKRRARGLHPSDPVVYVARYRYALLLSLGEELANEWWSTDEPQFHVNNATRLEGLSALRRSLSSRMKVAYAEPIARLKQQFGEIDDLTMNPDEFLVDQAPEITVNDKDLCKRKLGAQLFFTSIGVWEVEHLLTERPSYAIYSRRRRQQIHVVPSGSLELLLPRAILRRAMIFVGRDGEDVGQLGSHIVKAESSMLYPIDEPVLDPGLKNLVAGGWPANVGSLRRWIVRKSGRRGGALRSWHEHYNAACVISILLQREMKGTEARIEVIDAAVTELEKAVACGDSGFLASQSAWILSDDPDLAALRESQRFEDFRISKLGQDVGR